MELKVIVSLVLFGAVLLLNSDSYTMARNITPCPTLSSPTATWPEPTNCIYGITRDPCGRNVCAQGPGDRCQLKRFQVRANCGDGMYCSCGRCTGCSIHTFECYEQICVTPHHDD